MNIDAEKPPPKKKVKKIIALSFLVVLSIAVVLLYRNFNRLLSQALMRSFESSIISDVYELKFENLRVNFLDRTIRVFNVTVLPREKPLHPYPYINSSFRLKTETLTLKNVELFTLLKLSQLRLEQISITRPDVELVLAGDKYIFVPFKDSTAITPSVGQVKKKFIESFLLSEFQMADASFHVVNFKKQREFRIREFTISLQNLLINQRTRKDLLSFKQVDLSVGEFNGVLKKGAVKRVSFKDFKLGVESLEFQMTPDTATYNFTQFRTGLHNLDIQTADSLFHLTMQSFQLSYKDKAIHLSQVSIKPNMSEADMQRRSYYQHTQASGTVGSVDFTNVNFDSLIYHKGLFVHEIVLDKPEVSIFKDNTKPVDKNRLPSYFGQQISALPLPLWIRQVKATDVQLTNVERKRDSSYAKVTISQGKAVVKNITNRPTHYPLTLSASAYIENKVHFNLTLGFSYSKPEFSLSGNLEKFNLPDLNSLIQGYTPAKINSGTADEIVFSGTVYRTHSTGSMKFLYHDLVVDLELRNKAKWKSSVIAFAANTAVDSSNPGSNQLPPRIVNYRVDRDMHKGFINLIIKSVLTGVKETLIMSKENRKAYREAKKQLKQTRNK